MSCQTEEANLIQAYKISLTRCILYAHTERHQKLLNGAHRDIPMNTKDRVYETGSEFAIQKSLPLLSIKICLITMNWWHLNVFGGFFFLLSLFKFKHISCFFNIVCDCAGRAEPIFKFICHWNSGAPGGLIERNEGRVWPLRGWEVCC